MFLIISIFLLIESSLFFCGCAVMESAGRFLDGSLFEEKRKSLFKSLEKDGAVTDMELTVTENKNKETLITISILKYPMLKFRTANTGEDGSFHLSSLEYLAGSAHGWNEFTLELVGEGMFDSPDGILEITELETVQITKGRIQRYDTRLTGNEALTALRNRRERISAITKWMITQETPAFANIKEFTNYWEPLLFPEIVSAKKRPEGWLQEGDERKRTEDINWNHSYTERVFSEELWPVRNSGTMLRDWEEALSWIYMECEWNNILVILSDKIIFNKIK